MTDFTKVSGAGTLLLRTVDGSPNQGANTSVVTWTLFLICENGVSNEANPINYSATINGTAHTGTYTFDFSTGDTKTIASGTQTITHNSDGTKTISVSAHSDATGTSAIGGPIDVSGSYTLARIPKVPSAPASITPTVTGHNVSVAFTGSADNGGAAISSYTTQYSFNGGGYTGTVTDTASPNSYTGLAPGSYVFRVYATNSVGTGAVTTSAAVVIKGGGKRWNGTAFVSTTIAKRWTGSAWVDLTIAKRWTGSAWVDLS